MTQSMKSTSINSTVLVANKLQSYNKSDASTYKYIKGSKR